MYLHYMYVSISITITTHIYIYLSPSPSLCYSYPHSQCLLYITAGCCLALSFRYAGSHRKDVYDFLVCILFSIKHNFKHFSNTILSHMCMCMHTITLTHTHTHTHTHTYSREPITN